MMIMRRNNLAGLSSEDLEAKKKRLKRITVALAIVILILCFTMIYLTKTEQNFVVLPVALVCCLTIIICFISRNKINIEIRSRESEYIK